MPSSLGPIPPSKKVQKSKNTADGYWRALLNQVSRARHEPRITILLANIMIEYYMNEILIIRKKLTSHKTRLKYERKVELLGQEKEITPRITKNILTFYEIRNAYAHQMDVDWNWVINRIDVLCKEFPEEKFSPMPKLKYNKVIKKVVEEIAGKYLAVLVRLEQEHEQKIAKLRQKARQK